MNQRRELKFILMIGLAMLFVRTAVANSYLLRLIPPAEFAMQEAQTLRAFGESVLDNNKSVVFNQEQLKDPEFEQTVRLSLKGSCESSILRYYTGDHPVDEVLSFKYNVDLQKADPIEMQKLAINPQRYASTGYPVTVQFTARLTDCQIDCFGRTADFGSTKVVLEKTCRAAIVPERTSEFRLDEGDPQ